MGKFDLRGFNIRDTDDALEFVAMVANKMPQVEKVLKDHKLKVASMESRALFLEGKQNQVEQPQNDEVPDISVGDRMTGRVAPRVSNAQQSRIDQMRQANSTPAPSDEMTEEQKAAAAAALDNAIQDDPLDLPNGDSGPVAPGEIGALNIPNAQPHNAVQAGDAALPSTMLGSQVQTTPAQNNTGDTGPVDLAALAAAQGGTDEDKIEEEIADEAGTSKSEHATDDGLQQEDQGDESGEATTTSPVTLSNEDKTAVGDRVAKKQNRRK